MRRLTLVGLAALPLLVASCGGPQVAAFGESNDVVIIRGERAAAAAQALDLALTTESDWLVGEELFSTTVADQERLSGLTNRRHIVLLGTWDDSEMSGLVSSRVGGMEAGEPPHARIVEDIWAKGQVVVAVMGNDEAELTSYVTANAGDIAARLEVAARSRLARNLREFVEGTGFHIEMENRFGWSLCPPEGYDLFTGSEDAGLVFFRRVRPDRTLFVYWQDGAPSDVTEEFFARKRDELGALYFDGDVVERRRDVSAERVELGGLPALRISGWWGNRELVGGGPFRAYVLHDPNAGRVYIVDAALFAPGHDKTPLMRNLDAALHTFRPAPR